MIWLLLFCLLLPVQALANISFVQLGTAASGTTSVAPVMPASGVVAGDIFIMCVANKTTTPTPATPSTQGGWTAVSNNQGEGADGSPEFGTGTSDRGGNQVTLFYRIATADGESGAITSTVSAGNSAYAHVIQYHNSTGLWSVVAAQGGDSTYGTAYSAALNADPGIVTDDLLVACHSKTTDSAITTAASELITTSGMSYDTTVERFENGTSLGDDVGLIITEHPVLNGDSAGNISTASYTANASTVGGTVVLRLRQSGGSPPAPGCTTTLSSLAQATVQAAINAADTGATICFSAGLSATWTTTVSSTPSVTVNKGITLQGNTSCTGNGTVATPVTCTDDTIITDGTTTAASSDMLLITGTNARVTGFSFKDPRAAADSGPMVRMRCNSCRFDHNALTHTNTTLAPHGIIMQGYDGADITSTVLVDHNYFRRMNGGVNPRGDYPGEAQPRGSFSWKYPMTNGDSLAVYVEDNYFDSDFAYNGAYDAYDGSRVVFRYNLTKNYNMGGHGFDSGDRSTMRQELYRNIVTMPDTSAPSWFQTRGGNFMIWQNTITGNFSKSLLVTYYRSHPINQFYATTAGVPVSKHVCGGATNPDADQPTYNTTGNGYVFSSPNNVAEGNVAAAEQNFDGNTGGQFGYPCRDQPGYGPPATLAAAALDWPYVLNSPVYAQVLLPMYSWGNSYKGAAQTSTDIDIHAPNICAPSQSACPKPVPTDNDTRLETYHVLYNRELYIETATASGHGDGTVGVGYGTLAQRPATCTTGVGYFATDQGSWNTSGDGFGSGLFYKCTSTNTWTLNYTPYSYPHPLQTTFVPPLPQAPSGLRTIGTSTANTCTIIWNASSLSGLLGYHIFHGTSPGVYGPSIQVTATTAAAAHTPLLQRTFQLSQAGTHYFSVTAYNADADSAYATEITCVSTGVSRTAATNRSAR